MSRWEAKRAGPSWRRMAICILKNDQLCRYLSFSQTKQQRERAKMLIAKYGGL
ncbi:MAG: DUF3440 domain-containing protein [Rickettsiales bacterium]|nr:DUF3440 domain-containing protein [Rickettsiales bacterium]